MGEAKRRKQNDPNFGRVPQNTLNRGLVVSCPIEIQDSSLFARSSNLDPQELRFALLFWDRLVWPSSRIIRFGSCPDELFLENAGILSRPEYNIGSDGAQAIAKGQMQAFLDLERSEPGAWAMAQGENSLLLKDAHFEAGKGAFIELHHAIPIPTEDVPLIEILEFKEKRHDELILMRHQLDTFVLEIEEAADKPLALQKRIAELDDACANLLKVGNEWQFPVYLSNIKASFTLSPMRLLPAISSGWILCKPYGLTAATAVAAMFGAASTLEIKSDIGLRSINRPQSPYRYSYQIHKELR